MHIFAHIYKYIYSYIYIERYVVGEGAGSPRGGERTVAQGIMLGVARRFTETLVSIVVFFCLRLHPARMNNNGPRKPDVQ